MKLGECYRYGIGVEPYEAAAQVFFKKVVVLSAGGGDKHPEQQGGGGVGQPNPLQPAEHWAEQAQRHHPY